MVKILNPNIVGITLGAAASIVLFSCGLTAWAMNSINTINASVNQVSLRLQTLETRSAEAYTQNYTLVMAERDGLRMAIANPGLQVPDPTNPGRYLPTVIGTTK